MLTNQCQSIVNNSIYHIETQCDYNNIPDMIIESEASRIKKTLKKYNYPKKYIDEATREFLRYFNCD